MIHRVKEKITLEDVRLIWRNFAGEKRLYNENGKRNFSIALPEDVALELRRIGWNVKDNQRKVDEGLADELLYHLPVTVKMDGKRPPRMFLISKKWDERTGQEEPRRTQLDEETMMLLDYAEFDMVDVILRPFNWEMNGSQGVTAYLESLFATLHQDDLEKKYAHIQIEDDQLALEAADNVIDVDAEWVDDEEPLALPRGNS